MKKKKNKSNRKILDTIKNITKKTGQVEKEKREKKKRLKRNKPRGYMARMIGSIAFWVITSFVLLFIIVNIGGKSSDGEEITIVESEVTSYSAVEYSRSFLNDLFNIPEDSDEKTKREEKLKKYTINQKEIATSFDSDNVVKVDRKNIILKSMTKPENEERARHTFSLDLVIEEKFTEEESDEFDSLSKEERQVFIEKMMESDEGIISINNKKKIREERLYVVVAIEHNETGFVIYENPSFTFVHEENKGFSDMYSQLTALNDSEVTDNLERFLNTFFKSFANDDKDSLAYLLEDEEYSYGLGNTLDFEQVNEAQFFEGKDDDYIAKTSVVFVNNDTKLTMSAEYMLVIKKSGDKHVVTHINDDEYIYEVLFGEKEENEETSEEDNDNNNENGDDGETNEGLESSFNELIEAIKSNNLERIRPLFSEQSIDAMKKELIEEFELHDGNTDELSDEEVEQLITEVMESEKEDEDMDEETSELYKQIEDSDDFVVAFTAMYFSIFLELDEENEKSKFNSYTVTSGEKDNEYTLTYLKENEEEGASSKVEIELHFIEEDGKFLFDNSDFSYKDKESKKTKDEKDSNKEDKEEKSKKVRG